MHSLPGAFPSCGSHCRPGSWLLTWGCCDFYPILFKHVPIFPYFPKEELRKDLVFLLAQSFISLSVFWEAEQAYLEGQDKLGGKKGGLKFKTKIFRYVFSVPEGEAMAAGMLAISVFKQKVMYMGSTQLCT